MIDFNNVTITKLDSIPVGANIFRHDLDNMGTAIGRDLMIMHANHTGEECNFLIFCNLRTGERFRISSKELGM